MSEWLRDRIVWGALVALAFAWALHIADYVTY